MYDVVVIGGGPAGYVAAIKASQLGLNTACVEFASDEKGNQKYGGTCLNVGCIPSKSLLDSSHKYYEAQKDFASHGIDLKDLSVNIPSMMKRKDEVVNKLTTGITGLFKANGVEAISGRGKVINENLVEVSNNGDKTSLKTKFIILATGSNPIEIPIAKWSENIVDSTGALNFESVPERLGIIGAGVIGLELGSVWSRLGAEVTVIEAMDDFLPIVDKQISKECHREFKKQGLDIHLGSKLTSAKDNGKDVEISYESKGKELKASFDKLIVAQHDVKNAFPDKAFSIKEKKGIYARFFLHSLDKVSLEKFFKNASDVMNKADLLFVEYRNQNDSHLPKVTDTHYREYYTSLEISEIAKNNNLSVKYEVSGVGFAKYKHDDAFITRQIFYKN